MESGCAIDMCREITIVFDCGLHVSDRSVMVHPAVLMLASPVFRSMLTQNMSEKQRGIIELKGKDPKEFQVLLSFLTPGSSRLEEITVENCDFLLRWADEYCMGAIREQCVAFIKCQPPTVERVLQAYHYGIEDHLVFCIDHLLQRQLQDWGACTEDHGLLQLIFARSQQINNFLRDSSLPMLHKHRTGSLQGEQQLACRKCRIESSWGLHRKQCDCKQESMITRLWYKQESMITRFFYYGTLLKHSRHEAFLNR